MLETMLKIIGFLSLLTVWISFCPAIMQWLRIEGTSRPLMSGGTKPANKWAVGLTVMLWAGWTALFYHAFSSLVYWYLPGFFKNQDGYEAVAAIFGPALILAGVVLERMFSMNFEATEYRKNKKPTDYLSMLVAAEEKDHREHVDSASVPPNPLAAMSARLNAELEAKGFKVTRAPTIADPRLTATFVPRRKPKQDQ